MSGYPQHYPGLPLNEDNEVRLLKLHPGRYHDPIHCSLHNAPRDQVAYADALSYAWGKPPAARMIWVNDFNYSIRDNLYHALQNLRLSDHERILWIDALCIDQSNVEERNHQVQQMAGIFGKAKSVLVWLGLEYSYTGAAFGFLSESYLGSPTHRKKVMNDPRWLAVNELCQNEYWQRVWIVQEICLGANVVVLSGDQRIPWQYISAFRKARKNVWPQYQSHHERTFMRSLPARIDLQRELRASERCGLWSLIETFKNSLCQEFHDRIYGFMGLSTDCGSDGLIVDYKKSMPELHEDVLLLYRRLLDQNAAPQLLSLSEFLHVLFSRPGNNAISAPRLDTSKVDWSERAPGRPMPHTLLMTLTAIEVYEVLDFPTVFHDVPCDLASVHEFLEGRTPYSHIGSWRNVINQHVSNVGNFKYAFSFIALLRPPSRPGLPPNSAANPPLDRRAVLMAKPYRRANVVSEEVYGIAPAGTRKGDVVFAFVGSPTLLVFSRYDTLERASFPLSETTKAANLATKVDRDNGQYSWLLGRASILHPSEPALEHRDKVRLRHDKTIESTREAMFEPGHVSYNNVVYMDVQTLQEVSASMPTPGEAQGFPKPTVSLIPNQKRLPGIGDDPEQKGLQLDLEAMRKDQTLAKYAQGPGYAPIENPAALGSLCCIMQLFFILKPLREAILEAEPRPEDNLLRALQDLFWHMQYRSIPVSPMRLTSAMGWTREQIHEAQDMFEFYRVFSERLERLVGESVTNMWRGETRTTIHPPEYTYATRLEHFYDWSATPDLHYLLDCLEDDMLRDPYRKVRFTELADVMFIQMRFYKYDFATDSMTTWDGHFEYPPILDFKSCCEDQVEDTVYQLHAVAILEDTKPIPRYLLYLRPRVGEQWILFFKESVTYAHLSEVFEDNFRRPGYRMPKNAPMRTPYLLMYIRRSALEQYLG